MRVDHAIAVEHFALVAEIDARDRDVLLQDVLPHVHLRPVADRERAEMLAGKFAAVVEFPEFGSLVLRIPLAEIVAVAEHAFLRARLFLVAPAATDRTI